MGKGGGGSSNPAPSPYETELAKISKDLYESTSPLREKLITQGNEFLGGQTNPAEMPAYAPLYSTGRAGLEDQYGVAKENILSNTARGGALDSALGNLEASRAQQVGQLPAQISQGLIQDLMNKTYGAAFNSPGQAMGGLGSANQGWSSRANAATAAEAQQQQASMGMLGQLGGAAGFMLAMK